MGEYMFFYAVSIVPHLRGDVIRRSTEGACRHALIHVFLTHAEVCNLDVALGVQHHIIQLQISEDKMQKPGV